MVGNSKEGAQLINTSDWYLLLNGMNIHLEDRGEEKEAFDNQDLSPSTKQAYIIWLMPVLVAIVFATITGNLLVCLAIALEKKLQSVTNYMLMSLALADMAVALFVMPPAIIVLYLDGVWPFGAKLCAIWTHMDVMMCTSSIIHLTTISVDRYLAIASPLKHNAEKTRCKVLTKTIGVWLISALISCPVLVIGLSQSSKVMPSPQLCYLTDRYFKIYGSTGAFFIPLVVMLITYIQTTRILSRKAKLCRSFGNQLGLERKRPKIITASKGVTLRQSSLVTDQLMSSDQSKLVVPHLHDRVAFLQVAPATYHPIIGSNNNNNPRSSANNFTNNISESEMHQIPTSVESTPDKSARPFITRETREAEEDSSRRDSSSQHKRHQRYLTNEQRASKFLGVVFAAFVLCWLPFFLLNTIGAIRQDIARDIPQSLGTLFLWAGYASSMINPLLYVVFNNRFRHAYYQLIFCRYCSHSYKESERLRAIDRSIACLSFRTPMQHSNRPINSGSNNNNLYQTLSYPSRPKIITSTEPTVKRLSCSKPSSILPAGTAPPSGTVPSVVTVASLATVPNLLTLSLANRLSVPCPVTSSVEVTLPLKSLVISSPLSTNIHINTLLGDSLHLAMSSSDIISTKSITHEDLIFRTASFSSCVTSPEPFFQYVDQEEEQIDLGHLSRVEAGTQSVNATAHDDIKHSTFQLNPEC